MFTRDQTGNTQQKISLYKYFIPKAPKQSKKRIGDDLIGRQRSKQKSSPRIVTSINEIRSSVSLKLLPTINTTKDKAKKKILSIIDLSVNNFRYNSRKKRSAASEALTFHQICIGLRKLKAKRQAFHTGPKASLFNKRPQANTEVSTFNTLKNQVSPDSKHEINIKNNAACSEGTKPMVVTVQINPEENIIVSPYENYEKKYKIVPIHKKNAYPVDCMADSNLKSPRTYLNPITIATVRRVKGLDQGNYKHRSSSEDHLAAKSGFMVLDDELKGW